MGIPQTAPTRGTWAWSLREALRPRPDIPPAVLRKQIEIMHAHGPLGLAVNVLIACLLGWSFNAPGTRTFVLLWILATILLSGIRLGDCLVYRNLTLDREQLSKASTNLRLGAASQGLLWGIAGIFLLPESPLQQMCLMTILCGMTAGGLVILAPIWSTYALFCIPAVIPLSIRLMAGGLPTLELIGVLGLVYSFTMLFIAARTSRWLEDSLLAALDNEALALHLRSANEALVGCHAQLEAAVEVRTLELREANARLQEEFVAKEAERLRSEEREEALRRSQKLESLGLLAGGIAHDFNNLLGAVLGNLNLVQMQTPPDAQVQTYLGNMEKAVHQASNLTRQLLAYSGKGHFTILDLDLNQMVLDLTSLLDVCISKRAALDLDLGQDLPPINGDQAQLQQVVMNLVTNASEALDGEAGEIRIATRLQHLDEVEATRLSQVVTTRPGPHVLLEVSDTGRGMESEVLARIFDPFFTTKTNGRGLGLSAMLGILKGHGAGIEILSRPNEGSTFRLYFPVSPEAGGKPLPGAQGRPRTFHGRMLLVDDEPVLLETARAMLESLGMDVVTAGNGVQAMEYMASQGADIDLVLLDLAMPLMDGRQTFRALRRLRPGLPVIFCSGNDPRHAPRKGGIHDGRSFLRKPYSMDELRRALVAALGPARLEVP